MMGGSIGEQDSQGKRGQISPMAVCSMFAERRFHINQSCKEERFGSLDHSLRMCEMMEPYTSMSVRLAFVGSLKVKYERWNQKI